MELSVLQISVCSHPAVEDQEEILPLDPLHYLDGIHPLSILMKILTTQWFLRWCLAPVNPTPPHLSTMVCLFIISSLICYLHYYNDMSFCISISQLKYLLLYAQQTPQVPRNKDKFRFFPFLSSALAFFQLSFFMLRSNQVEKSLLFFLIFWYLLTELEKSRERKKYSYITLWCEYEAIYIAWNSWRSSVKKGEKWWSDKLLLFLLYLYLFYCLFTSFPIVFYIWCVTFLHKIGPSRAFFVSVLFFVLKTKVYF